MDACTDVHQTHVCLFFGNFSGHTRRRTADEKKTLINKSADGKKPPMKKNRQWGEDRNRRGVGRRKKGSAGRERVF